MIMAITILWVISILVICALVDGKSLVQQGTVITWSTYLTIVALILFLSGFYLFTMNSSVHNLFHPVNMILRPFARWVFLAT